MKKIFLCVISLFLSANVAFAGQVTKKIPRSSEEVLLSFAPLVKKASPAVVNIYTKRKIQVRGGLSPFFSDPVFKHFFGNNFPGGVTTERVESSLGSGVIVKDDGLIVTNYHVISGSEDITVVLNDRREFAAKIVLKDDKTDLALLKIDAKGEKLAFLEFMDSDDLEVGDIVMAIGNPFGVGQTVTNGIVSAVARTTVGVSDYQFFIQTDAAINPGNSGGALVAMNGKLAGINSAIFSKSGGSNGIGFAIPANMVAAIVRGSESDGYIVHPWLGITTQRVTQDIANSLGLKRPVGAIISDMHEAGPAKDAGLELGDVVLAIDGHEVLDEHSLRFRVATHSVGEKAVFQVRRGGKNKNIKVAMVAPPELPKRDFRVLGGRHALSGTTVGNLSPALADELGLNYNLRGVIIAELKRGVASGLGFHKKDVVKAINGQEVTTSEQLQKILEKGAARWNVTVKRGNRQLNVIWAG